MLRFYDAVKDNRPIYISIGGNIYSNPDNFKLVTTAIGIYLYRQLL